MPEYTKATTLLIGVAIQSEFGKYLNCINKVERTSKPVKYSQAKKVI